MSNINPQGAILLPCPVCEHSVSSHAPTCPNCGHPLHTNAPKRALRLTASSLSRFGMTCTALSVLFVILSAQSANYLEREQDASFGGLGIVLGVSLWLVGAGLTFLRRRYHAPERITP